MTITDLEMFSVQPGIINIKIVDSPGGATVSFHQSQRLVVTTDERGLFRIEIEDVA